MVALVRGFRLPSWTPVGDWRLPGGVAVADAGVRYEGIHVLEDGSVLLAMDTPMGVYKLPMTATAIDTCM